MTTMEPSKRRAAAAWSRRPFVGTLPKVMVSSLPAAGALAGLAGLLQAADVEGSVDGATAWLKPKGGPQPPAVTLRLRIIDDPDGAKVECRFDTSRWDTVDLWVYALVASVGFVVAAAWLGGNLSSLGKAMFTSVSPLGIGGLAVLSTGHYAFRRWRRNVRNRLFDRTMIALGVPVE